VPGAPEAVRWLRDQGLTVRFTTNTTRSPRPPSPDRVARPGSPASEDELVTPIAVAERLFASSPQARVLAGCLAGPGDRVTHVLVAESRPRGDLRRAGPRLPGRPGRAELVATRSTGSPARDDGEHLDTGGWVRLLEYATGERARVLGKPSPEFFTAPLDALGRGPETALVVGDDLEATSSSTRL
jgi:ribonucleotide monophosphatase NagD (HAD superfamily)